MARVGGNRTHPSRLLLIPVLKTGGHTSYPSTPICTAVDYTLTVKKCQQQYFSSRECYLHRINIPSYSLTYPTAAEMTPSFLSLSSSTGASFSLTENSSPPEV